MLQLCCIVVCYRLSPRFGVKARPWCTSLSQLVGSATSSVGMRSPNHVTSVLKVVSVCLSGIFEDVWCILWYTMDIYESLCILDYGHLWIYGLWWYCMILLYTHVQGHAQWSHIRLTKCVGNRTMTKSRDSRRLAGWFPTWAQFRERNVKECRGWVWGTRSASNKFWCTAVLWFHKDHWVFPTPH